MAMRTRLKQTALLAMYLCVIAAFSCFDVPTDTKPKISSEVEDWRDEIIYQVMIDRFANGDKNNDYGLNIKAPTGWHGGDWQGLIDKLDYLGELGVTTLWISPAVKNVEEDAGIAGYHGYWTQHFQDTNPHFGDMHKLRELVAQAHKRDMKIILDIVTNHIGQLFYYDINLNGSPNIHTQGSGYCYANPNAPGQTNGVACNDTESRLIRVTEWDPDYDPRGVQAYTSLGESGIAPIRWVYMPEVNRVPPMPKEFQNEAWYNRRGRVVTPWGWNETAQVETADFPGGLKDIKTTHPDVRAKLIEVFSWWIEETNIDGFRIDTVKHIEHEFWQVFTAGIRKRTKAMGKHNFLMFGEVFDGDDALLGSYTQPGELDSVFYFSQKFQVFDDVFKHGAAPKKIEDLMMQRTQNYGNQGQVDGITDASGQPLSPQAALVNFIDNHDVPRFLYEYDNLDGAKLALFYLLTMDGIPCIYYGTEQGYNGGNDPANREDMWRKPEHVNFTLHTKEFKPFDREHPLYQHIRTLNTLRKNVEPLRRGDLTIRWASAHNQDEQDAGIFAFERTYNGTTALVVFNNSDTPSTTSTVDMGGEAMTTSFAPGTILSNVFGEKAQTITVGAAGAVDFTLPAKTGMVFLAK